MREIKFRAWSPNQGSMNLFDNPKDGIEYCEGEIWVSSGWDGYDRPTYDEKTDHVVMQYTGLKDSNGVEIYESDVVTYMRDEDDDRHTAVVVFSQHTMRYQLETGCGSHDLCSWFELEVVGNIHMNPELLESK